MDVRPKSRFLIILVAASLLAQDKSKQPAEAAMEGPLIRVSVNLVQVDAVVVDKKGMPVPDLTADDFEILQDGKKQKITRFSYIAVNNPSVPKPKGKAPAPVPGAAPILSATLKAEQIRRTMVLVVDDLGLSFESIVYIKDAIKSIARSLQPGDLVALMRTGIGTGALQTFTSDPQQLIALADQLRWNPRSRTGISAVPAVNQNADDPEDEGEDRVQDLIDRTTSTGTLGAVSWMVQALQEMPGRKSVVLLSEGFRAFGRDQSATPMLEQMRRLGEQASRSGVVIYSVEPRGLQTLGFTAADKVDPRRITATQDKRRDDFVSSQDPLQYLARETGGKFFSNSNSIDDSLRRVLQDQSGFYLLGYDPGDDSFNRKFHNIKVRLKKPGLEVRSRSGYLGVADKPGVQAAAMTREQQMLKGLRNPFTTSEIPVKLTGLYMLDGATTPVIQCLAHIDLRALQFETDAAGVRNGKVSILLVGFDGDGVPADQSNYTYNVKVKPEQAAETLATGMLFTVRYPVKKPGPFQLRAVVRDELSAKIGSASQFLIAPDFAKGRLALSGIVLSARTDAGKPVTQESLVSPAARQFHISQQFIYGLQVLNARLEGGAPKLKLQMRLFDNGRMIYQGEPMAVSAQDAANPKAITAGGMLRLGKVVKPGEYVLQLNVTDEGGRKPVTLSQWTDFRVVE